MTPLQSLNDDLASPSEMGGFVGDIFYGDPRNSTRGTHRWDGDRWVEIPSEAETLVSMLATSRQVRDDLAQHIGEMRIVMDEMARELEKIARTDVGGLQGISEDHMFDPEDYSKEEALRREREWHDADSMYLLRCIHWRREAARSALSSYERVRGKLFSETTGAAS